MRVVLTITRNDATPAVQELRAALANRLGLSQAAAGRMLIPVQASLRHMAQTNHNQFGARSTFWTLMTSGTNARATEEAAIVSLPAPVALRYFGGTVVPVVAHMLAIPNRLEAYGKSPRDFPGLKCIPFKSAGGGEALALVEDESKFARLIKVGRGRSARYVGVKRGDEINEADVYFWLVPMVTIAGNKEILPDDAAILDAAMGGIRSYLGRLARGMTMEAQ